MSDSIETDTRIANLEATVEELRVEVSRHTAEILAIQNHWIATHEEIKKAIDTSEKAMKVAIDLLDVVKTALAKVDPTR